jgi:RimJ/RimL family protein N-acetyltransferase
MSGDVVLRDVTDDDLPLFYAHQAEPEAVARAAFPARDPDAFAAHWARIRADDGVVTKAVLMDGEVTGNIVSWEQDGKRLIGYWIGQDYWGRGIATKALRAFVEHLEVRPLYAIVAQHNVGSIRVLEKCGFSPTGKHRADDGIEEFTYELA